jgi:glyoxylase-like metal-dependent hydrolase (beta-lactamase superfamily II)
MGAPIRQVAEGVWQVPLAVRSAVNAYVVGDVLVDAGTERSGRALPGLLRAEGRRVVAHALTHAHPDHVGGSAHVRRELGVPMWAPAGDADDVEAGRPHPAPGGGLAALVGRVARFPAVPVARRLREGDEIGGFRVLETPGHSPGHLVLWREADRVLVCGDVVFGMLLPRLRAGLREPFAFVTPDVARNQASIRRIAALEPELLLPGHGPPMRAAAPRLRAFADALP